MRPSLFLPASAIALLATVGGCDPGYWLVNSDGQRRDGVVHYSRVAYELEAPAELHGLAGNSWLNPGFAVSRFADTVRIEGAVLYAKGRRHQPVRLPLDSLTFAPGPAIRPLGLEWRFPDRGISSVVPDSCEFVIVIRAGSSPADSVRIRYHAR